MSEPSVPILPTPWRWTQFSLKTLMLLMLLSAAFLGGWSVAYRRALEAEAIARHEAEAARMSEMHARELAEQQTLQSRQTSLVLAQLQQSMAPTSGSPDAATSSPAASDTPAAAIEAMLRLQAEAWNAGQIDRFMDHYWRSDELTFSAGGQTTRGWQNTLDRYRQRYPTIEKMGQLTFDRLEIQPLGETAALVLGRWRLARAEDALEGNFSLIVRKLDGRWLIVHDHTSRAEQPDPSAGEAP